MSVRATERGEPRFSRIAGLWLAATVSFGTATAHGEPGQAPPACLSSYESAQRLKLDKKLLSSKKALLTCSRNDCPVVLRRDCAEWLREIEAAVPSVVVAARSQGRDVTAVRVLVDGEIIAESLDGASIELDPGQHVFRFELEGAEAVEQTVLVREGEKNRIIAAELGRESSSAPAPNRIPVYGLAALGAVGIGSFVFFGLRSHAAKEDLESCKGHCPVDDVHAVERDQLVADVSLGLGLVALGAAAYLYFGEPKAERAPTTAWRLQVAPLRGGAAAALGTRF